VRQTYYRDFKDLLFGQVQGDWITYLQSVKIPPGPNDDYGYGYNALKAYLLTTSEYKRTDQKVYQDFLAGALATRWAEGREGVIDKQLSDLAKLQFDFYASDLANGNPYSDQAQADTVEHARDYLWKFNAKDRVYQALLAEASRKGNMIVFNRDWPGSDRVIRNTYPVPAGYTKNAWPYMKQLIGEAEKRFGGEGWVLGKERGPSVTDWTALKKELADKYQAEYINEWRKFVNDSRFVGYGGYADEANKLGILSDNGSPLLRLFWVISTNTNVDPAVKANFDGAAKVVPPDSPALITASTQGYMTALNQLQLSIKSAAENLNASTSDASKNAAQAATTARYSITSNFVPDTSEAHIDKKMTELLQDPIRPAEVDLKGPLNAAGRQFCAASAFGKFPFNPASSVDATLPEVNAIFRPKDGALWQFYENTLKQNLTCSAAGCTPTGVAPPLSPSFVSFFSEAVRFSKALYGEAGTDPKLTYTMTPRSDQVEAFTFTVDGARTTLKNGQSGNYNWSSSTNTFGIGLRLSGGAGDLATGTPYTGLWAPFHFFADADANIPSGAATIFVMKPRQGKSGKIILEYQVLVDTHGAPAVFSKNFWNQLRCIPGVAR
jgi:type VI secretion system protein ImpL